MPFETRRFFGLGYCLNGSFEASPTFWVVVLIAAMITMNASGRYRYTSVQFLIDQSGQTDKSFFLVVSALERVSQPPSSSLIEMTPVCHSHLFRAKEQGASFLLVPSTFCWDGTERGSKSAAFTTLAGGSRDALREIDFFGWVHFHTSPALSHFWLFKHGK